MLPRTCAPDNAKILDVEIAHDSPSKPIGRKLLKLKTNLAIGTES
jgi:hypothetical protein